MRLKHDRPIRPFALAAPAAMIATILALVFGAEIGLAADFQEGKHNVCEGTFTSPSCSTWGTHVEGFENVALGDEMMPALTKGSDNVALDIGALNANTTGSNNLALGGNALFKNTTGANNLAFGTKALASNTGGSNNIALSRFALEHNTTDNNIAIGAHALFENTTGENNIAIGVGALEKNTTGSGSFNTALGTEALLSNTTGAHNLASGPFALAQNTTGKFNVASGFDALLKNTTGEKNVASGENALFENTMGNSNTASGFDALLNNTTGSANVAVGSEAGKKLTTGSNNIDISNEGVASEAGTTRIGTEGKQTRAFVAGAYKVAIPGPLLALKVNSSGQLGTAKTSSARFKEDVRGLGASASRVLSLRPVSFRYKPQYAQGPDQLEYGLIAEQVARLFPSLVQYEANGKPGGVYYEELPVLLLAQLKHEHAALRDTRAQVSHQQHQIDQLASELQALRAEIHSQR